MNWFFDELKIEGEKDNMKCQDFEKDENIACDGDNPCCAICKFNNKITDKCLIGRDK